MKHTNLLNSHTYYKRITSDQFNDDTKRLYNSNGSVINRDNITDDEIQSIKKLLPNCKYELISHHIIDKSVLVITNDGIYINLVKSIDEWYYIYIKTDVINKYFRNKTWRFKCDQLDGLLECISSLLR